MMRIALSTPRAVMIAFLSGAKLQNKHYGDAAGEYFLYLDAESGFLCEEDGAGAKVARTDHFTFRNEDPQWCILLPDDAPAPTIEGQDIKYWHSRAEERLKEIERLEAGPSDDAARWRHFADSPQTALMLGSNLDPNDKTVDWVAECSRLADHMRTR